MSLTKNPLACRCLKHAVGIRTAAGPFTPLIPEGTPLPVTFTDTFSTAADGQPAVRVSLAWLDPAESSTSTPIATLELGKIASSRRGMARVQVRLEVDEHGWLTASIRDRSSGNERTLRGRETLATREMDGNGVDWDKETTAAGNQLDAMLARRAPRKKRLAVAGIIALAAAGGLFLIW